MRILITILSFSFIIYSITLMQGCGGSVELSKTVEVKIKIPLGNDANNFFINKKFFLGHRVDSFRVNIRYVNPDRNQIWPNDALLIFNPDTPEADTLSQRPTNILNNNSFWTSYFIDANQLSLRIETEDNFVGFLGGSPYFEILAIEYAFKENSQNTDVPSPTDQNDSDKRLIVDTQVEVIGISPSLREAQHYVIPNPNSYPVGIIYVSPFSPTVFNDIGLKIAVSTDGFKDISDDDGWITPEHGDSGIFHEFSFMGNNVYLTVVSDIPAPYFLSFQKLVATFSNIVMQKDANLVQAPDIDMSDYNTNRPFITPYNKQIANFLQPTASYNRRIRELLVFASARMLDATEGQLRYGNTTLFTALDQIRDVDMQFNNMQGRANADWNHINMYLSEINSPNLGGRVLVHEWGHWFFAMPDEYIDISGNIPDSYSEAIDPNSLMGSFGTTEFCDDLNHLWSQPVPGQQQESAWELLMMQISLPNSQNTLNKTSYQGTYLDVLHKLESLMGFNII